MAPRAPAQHRPNIGRSVNGSKAVALAPALPCFGTDAWMHDCMNYVFCGPCPDHVAPFQVLITRRPFRCGLWHLKVSWRGQGRVPGAGAGRRLNSLCDPPS